MQKHRKLAHQVSVTIATDGESDQVCTGYLALGLDLLYLVLDLELDMMVTHHIDDLGVVLHVERVAVTVPVCAVHNVRVDQRLAEVLGQGDKVLHTHRRHAIAERLGCRPGSSRDAQRVVLAREHRANGDPCTRHDSLCQSADVHPAQAFLELDAVRHSRPQSREHVPGHRHQAFRGEAQLPLPDQQLGAVAGKLFQ